MVAKKWRSRFKVVGSTRPDGGMHLAFTKDGAVVKAKDFPEGEAGDAEAFEEAHAWLQARYAEE